MQEALKKLCELQEIDSDVSELKRKLTEIPKKKRISEEKIKKIEGEVQELKEILKNKELQRDAHERDIQQTRMNLSKHKTQLLSAKTNKEYSTLLKEIEWEEKSVERAEEETIMNIMEVEKFPKELKEKKKELENTIKKETKEMKNLAKQKNDLEKEIKKKRLERENIASHVSFSQLMTYERIRKGRGAAVAFVEGNMCTGCHTILPPQFISQIRGKKKIYTCEECGRILVWHEDAK